MSINKIENIIEKATRIAVEAHKNQTRKADDSPYIIHPFMVALKLQKYNFEDEIIAAALTHDVLEDTDYPVEKFREELGDEVYKIVKAVTNDGSLDWEEKKKQYVETVRNGSEGAKAVSVADKIHNLECLLIAYKEQGQEVWKKFNRGKDKKVWFETEVLKMLKETWQHPLIEEYEKLLEIFKKETEEDVSKEKIIKNTKQEKSQHTPIKDSTEDQKQKMSDWEKEVAEYRKMTLQNLNSSKEQY